MRKGWNFHNDIAINLEEDARNFFREIERPYTKIYDADAIEGGCFVEVMIILIREQTNFDNSNEKIDDFVKKCAPYLGKSSYDINPADAERLYSEFRGLFY